MHSLLIPLDDSPCALRALAHAERLARAHGLRLRLLNVQQPGLYASLLEGVTHGVPMVQSLREHGAALLVPHVERLRAAGLTVSHAVVLDAPAAAICADARHHGCVRIIMGTRGNDSLARVVLGSVASQVAAQSPVPVTLIK
ncbi:universal stress protein [Chitinilyticum litopenaei]|uniref:universal stress protein n=1 Tax=Chitinilyticum litopenaei TaxID=1121276 RepID=UPI0003FD7331|nr:universal stress protein [Chitinilyticum litopenaei]